MIYDDDTGTAIHHPIFSGDQASAAGQTFSLTPATQELIAKLARKHRNWGADRILAELQRREVKGVSLDMVKSVLEVARRAGRRG